MYNCNIAFQAQQYNAVSRCDEGAPEMEASYPEPADELVVNAVAIHTRGADHNGAR
jgi:hypothetical protein